MNVTKVKKCPYKACSRNQCGFMAAESAGHIYKALSGENWHN